MEVPACAQAGSAFPAHLVFFCQPTAHHCAQVFQNRMIGHDPFLWSSTFISPHAATGERAHTSPDYLTFGFDLASNANSLASDILPLRVWCIITLRE
jgi:hypothetical protein